MNQQQKHELALLYAQSKLNEYQVDRREAPMCGNTDMSAEEVQYLEKAYLFAVENLN